MAVMTAEADIDTDQFFKEISRGRQFLQETVKGGTVMLYLHDPDVLDIGRASDLFDQLKAGVDRRAVRETLIRLVCLSCIDGVNDRNVSAFLHAFPAAPIIVIEGLRLLKISDGQMREAGINPEGGLMETGSPEAESVG